MYWPQGAMLHDATFDGISDRLETYRSTGSGFNGDASNFVGMIFGIVKANNLVNGNQLDLDGLSNAVQALVCNFLDANITLAKTDNPSANPFNGLSATDTPTTTVEQDDDEEGWEKSMTAKMMNLSPDYHRTTSEH